MKYKRAKQIIERNFAVDGMLVDFGWRFRIYPRLRKQIKQWAREISDEV